MRLTILILALCLGGCETMYDRMYAPTDRAEAQRLSDDVLLFRLQQALAIDNHDATLINEVNRRRLVAEDEWAKIWSHKVEIGMREEVAELAWPDVCDHGGYSDAGGRWSYFTSSTRGTVHCQGGKVTGFSY